jgi:hypothetical protein
MVTAFERRKKHVLRWRIALYISSLHSTFKVLAASGQLVQSTSLSFINLTTRGTQQKDGF